MDTIHAVIVGAGRGGSSLINILRNNPYASVRYVIDQEVNAPGMQLAREMGITTLESIEQLQEKKDYDIIINVTGNDTINDQLMAIAPHPSLVLNTQLSAIMYRLLIDTMQLNRELDKTNRYFENIISNSRDMIITAGTDGRIIRFNRGGELMLGFTESQVIGKPVADFYAKKEDRDLAVQLMNERGYISNFETTLTNAAGDPVYISLTLTPLFDEENNYLGTVGVSKDITQKRKNEQTIREKNRQLEALTSNLEELVHQRTSELEKANERLVVLNQYRSQFIANMSHELRTPLNSIIGFSEILIDGGFGELNEKQLKYANNINRSGHHLLQIINDILDLSKIDAGKMEMHYSVFDINELIRNSLFMFESTASRKHLKLNTHLTAKPLFVNADMGRVKQVLYNLISNAVKFKREEGSVTVSTQSSGESVRVTVVDTGIGITSDDLPRIFNEFEQVDNSYSREFEGTGLGLPLVKRFLQMMGSDIQVESAEGKGTTFWFEMKLNPSLQSRSGGEASRTETDAGIPPVKEQATTQTLTEGASSLHHEGADSAISRAPLILIIEDDPGSMELMALTLSEQGYKTAHAYSGSEGVEKARKLKPDCITLDIMLPGMDGWEVIQTLKQDPTTESIPIVIVTMTDNRSLALSLGAVDFVTKPIDRNSFKRLISSILAHYYLDREEISVLVVDDMEENLELVSDILGRFKGNLRIHTRTARSGLEAYAEISKNRPDLLVLDLMMPEVSGFDVIKHLKNEPENAHIPIVVLTAMSLTEDERSFLEKETERVILKSEMNIETFLNVVSNAVARNQQVPGGTQ